jgi:RNA polymerase sigma-70 factor (ECF subfamily)
MRDQDTNEVYERLRPLLFSIAYRMLGSVSEAEDVVQEAFLRYHRAGKEAVIESPKSFLSAVTTRLSIDQLRAARTRRETYVGPWLPEPLVTDDDSDPAEHAETADSLSLAFLVLLETLTPLQRAVFLLREVFDYGYDEIARIVDTTEEACRQLAVRARKQVDARRPRFEASRERRRELARRFFAAAQRGDTEGLVRMLADDVVAYGDGGGKAPTFVSPVYGREAVARLLLSLAGLGRRVGMRIRHVEVNGQPGILFRGPDGRLINVLSLDIAEGRVQTLRAMSNPDKLRHLGPLADARRLFRERGGSALPDSVILGDEPGE